jgi:hypothetical protein
MFAIDKFRIMERKRAAAAAKLAHANDNRRAERHAPVTPCRTALVGHWRMNEQSGRLEWHWSLELVADEPETPAGRCAEDTPAGSSRASNADEEYCHPTVT